MWFQRAIVRTVSLTRHVLSHARRNIFWYASEPFSSTEQIIHMKLDEITKPRKRLPFSEIISAFTSRINKLDNRLKGLEQRFSPIVEKQGPARGICMVVESNQRSSDLVLELESRGASVLGIAKRDNKLINPWNPNNVAGPSATALAVSAGYCNIAIGELDSLQSASFCGVTAFKPSGQSQVILAKSIRDIVAVGVALQDPESKSSSESFTKFMDEMISNRKNK